MKQDEKSWYVADFETTGENYFKEHGCTRVWLWAISDSEGNISKWGTDIESFFSFCRTIPNSVIYFHNLKFDGSFILSWLLTNGFRESEKLKIHDAKGFQSLIDEDGAYYMIKCNLGRRIQVTFQDSLKVIPLKVSAIAKAFNLPIEKEVIDYDDYTVDDDRLRYVFHDVQIVAMAMRFFRNKGYTKMTIGSNAYNDYRLSNDMFKATFPMLDREWLIKWRNAYRGGRSQVNPRYANKVVEGVRRYDINSMYPYAMSRFPMPFGKPMKVSKPGRREFELYEVRISFRLKKGHLPTLLKKGSMFGSADTYYTETEGVEPLLISNIDLDLLKRHYDIFFLEYDEIWAFHTMRTLFTDWIDRNYENKAKAEGGLRLVYKLLINNLYGKFGSKCVGAKKIPMLGPDGELAFKKGEDEEMRCYYLPVAIAIVSWCHKLIDDAIMETGYDKFVYCDTDSVHTLGTLPDEWVDDKEIGKFKLEAIETKAKYVRQKCYVHKEPGKDGKEEYTITCAGMTNGIKEWLIEENKDDIFSVFGIGLTVSPTEVPKEKCKLRPMQVRGGTILVPIGFRLL